MAWFKWRKDKQDISEPEQDLAVPAPQAPVVAIEADSPAQQATADVLASVEAVESSPEEPEAAAEAEVVVVAEPEPVVVVAEPEPVVVVAEPEPAAAAEPEPVVAAEPEPVVTAPPAAPAVPGSASWNPTVGGVVVRIVHTSASEAGSAEDVRVAVEQAIALAVGPHSPAPADAAADHPVVLQLTLAEELVDADVEQTLLAVRKQLARKATRVRLVVEQVPLAEI